VLSAAVFLVVPALPAGAQSQWVDWNLDTAARLQLSVVSVNDNQEKDVTVGDFDNDGDTDLVIVRKVPFSTPGSQINVLLMNEDGVLVDRTVALIPGFMTPDDSRDVLAFDCNGNGWLDILTVNTFGQAPRLFINQGVDGKGTFLGWIESLNWFSPAFVPGPKFCAAYDGDIDNDGDLDLYFSDYDNTLEDRLLINDGNGHFTDETDLRFPTGINNSVFGTASFIHDFNLDGWPDILRSSGAFEPLKLLINNQAGRFELMQILPSNAVYMVRSADFDNDGRRDMYVVSDGQDYLLMNDSTNPNGTINVTQVNVSSSTHTSGFGGNVHVTDLDRDGFLDVGVADVDVDIPGCVRRFAALRNTLPDTGNDGFHDPNNPQTLAWNTQGVHDFAWIDINGDQFMDLFQATCSGYRVFMMEPFELDIVGDIDGDGVVGILDFLLLLGDWGNCPDPCPPTCAADLDADCTVGILDFLLLLGNWG